MDPQLIEASARLLYATAAGGVIGLERAYNGRAAGFRTHILVCTASALLMLLMQYQWLAVPEDLMATVRVDPTRMAQGIMTGIGFLGAGVILRDRRTVRGLTTAASIWITSAIGIIIGSGFFTIGAVATALVLGTLSLFRWLESHIRSRQYAQLIVIASLDVEHLEEKIRELVKESGLRMTNCSYEASLIEGWQRLQTTVSTFQSRRFRELQHNLLSKGYLQSFQLLPSNN